MLAVLALTAACALHGDVATPKDSLQLDAHVEYLRPAAGTELSYDELTREPACTQFKRSKSTPNFGGAAGAVWLRFQADLTAAAPTQWRLVVRFPGLDKVCVYWPLVSGKTTEECVTRKTESARWESGRLLFAVPAGYSSASPVHLYARSDYWLKVPLELATADALLRTERGDEFDWGLYHGLMLAFSLIGLVFYIGARDRTHLYFSLHVAALTLALLIWHGELTRFDPAGDWLTQLLLAAAGLFVTAGACFYQSFLDTRTQLQRAHRLLQICLWLGLAPGVLVWLWPQAVTRLVGALGLFWLGTILWATSQRVRQGYRPAQILLAAITVLLLGVFFAAASAVGLPLLPPDLAVHLVQFGGLLATGLLSVGMMLRVRSLVAERDQASEIAMANQKLAMHRLLHDEITGLTKRSKFREDLQARLQEARRHAHKLALVSLCLDNFRALSHALSQEDRDEALAETALRLRESLAPGELLGSISSDSFVWLTQQGDAGDNYSELRARCNHLRSLLSAPLARARGASLHTSMGIALYPQHSSSAESLLRNSDEALYRAQQQGGGVNEMFQPAMSGHSERNLELSKDLQQAILRNELELYYQPIIPLDGSGLYSAEALLRWNYKGKIVTPDQFIPAAEASGLIIPISDWVLRQAGRQVAEWRRRKLPVLSVSVNISAQEFRPDNFVQRIESALAETSAPGSGIVLELTEGMLVDDLGGAANILNHLASSGIKAAVDDFGVGYSSLSYLRNLPVQSIKIDRSFLKGVPNEMEAVSVINAIITMGRELGLKITAEGIETPEQMNFLARRGVTAGQGWLFAKAMPAAAFEAWVQQPRNTRKSA